jgi:hypothetical protein
MPAYANYSSAPFHSYCLHIHGGTISGNSGA